MLFLPVIKYKIISKGILENQKTVSAVENFKKEQMKAGYTNGYYY